MARHILSFHLATGTGTGNGPSRPPLWCMFLIFAVTLSSCSTLKRDNNIDNSVVQTVDIDRYMGTWYEAARFPHSFEKGMVGVKAEYSLMDNGKIRVVNSGYKNSFDGKFQSVRGKAKIPDPEEPGKLKVSFFLFFYADYYILELDRENYQWALVGSSSPDFLWVLSREKEIHPGTYQALVEKARERGYDVSRLEKVPQKP